uniref:Uncharacterized protein n=1 Tax=Setaria italica TaxID=4555 RepID=K4AI12_SETIT
MFTTTEHPGVSRQHPFSSCISLSETGLIYSFPNMHSAFFFYNFFNERRT